MKEGKDRILITGGSGFLGGNLAEVKGEYRFRKEEEGEKLRKGIRRITGVEVPRPHRPGMEEIFLRSPFKKKYAHNYFPAPEFPFVFGLR